MKALIVPTIALICFLAVMGNLISEYKPAGKCRNTYFGCVTG